MNWRIRVTDRAVRELDRMGLSKTLNALQEICTAQWYQDMTASSWSYAAMNAGLLTPEEWFKIDAILHSPDEYQ